MWSAIEDITYKNDWYTKVFDQSIVDKWESEVPQNKLSEFKFAIGLLRASAQGYLPARHCTHVDKYECIPCRQEFLDKLTDAGFAAKYGLKTKDIAKVTKKYLDDPFGAIEELHLEDEITECLHSCGCTPADTMLSDYVVYESCKSSDTLLKLVDIFCEIEPPSWHPGSGDKIRNIIHPSLHCYIKGTTRRLDGTVKVSKHESRRYQWLPSDFRVNEDGQVKVMSRINGLDMIKNGNMIPELELAFAQQLPWFEQVMRMKLTNTTLQVICKIARVELNKNTKPEYDGGSWHIEGTPYEHIVAASVQYLDVQGLTPSFLEFRKPTIINEEAVRYEQNDDKYTKTHYGIENHHEGQMHIDLGNIRCDKNKCVVFPNTLQHRVMPFRIAKGYTIATRTILAFFVIDPSVNIIGTNDVLDSREYISEVEALGHRDRLMIQRKFFVDELNKEVYAREFSLCEH